MRGVTVAVLALLIGSSIASRGDSSYVHKKCVARCWQARCTEAVRQAEESYRQSVYGPELLFFWDCESECEYSCMWSTVTAFESDGIRVPQFHGKWPFIRLYTIQEPASMFFSLLNAAAQVFGILWFRKALSKETPMFYCWHMYFLVAIFAWTWSTIFHTRDYPFTEKMDYLGATSLVAVQVYCLLARLLVGKPRGYAVLAGIGSFVLYAYHLYRLGFVHFDYSYHVNSTVFVGVLNALGWLVWCASVWQRQPYVWSCALTMVALSALVLLEVLDFPPFLWVLDAHSLWHLGTAPLTLLWYRFLVDDGRYVYNQMEKQKNLA